MLNPNKTGPEEAVQTLGECHPLLEQLGSADGLLTLSGAALALRLPKVDSQTALAHFLGAYQAQVLLPLELPAICRAHHHASHQETRELVALDREITKREKQQPFGLASRRVGRSQLERLRPLRGERIVQRYLDAVESGRAQAWHTLVYGLTLAVYSLPVRQGLLTYARQTLRGFIQATARPLRLSAAECATLLDDACAGLPEDLEGMLKKCPLTKFQ
jgi:urease accessory protein UreF